MNLKNMFKLSTLILFLSLVVSSMSFGQTRYLNSTDGDDGNDGLTAATAVKTLERAMTLFPDGATVYTKAGEYKYDQSGIGGGNDANGYNLNQNKSMTFIIESYSGSDIMYLCGGAAGGTEDLTINIGAGKTLTFQAANAGVQSVVVGDAPLQVSNLDAINLTSGTLNVSGLASFNVTDAGIVNVFRTDGSVTGTFTYSANNRTFTYNSAADVDQVAGGELDLSLDGGILTVAMTNVGTPSVTFPDAITATTGGRIEVTNVGSAIFSNTVTITGGAAAPTQIQNTAAGSMTFNGAVTISSESDGDWGNFVQNTAAGSLTIQTLNINHGGVNASDLDNGGEFTDADAGAHTFANFIRNTGEGTLTLGVVTHGTYDPAPAGAPFYYVYVDYLQSNAAGTLNIGGATTSNIYGLIQQTAAGTVRLNGNVTINESNVVSDYALDIAAGTLALQGNTLELNTSGNTTATVNNAGAITSTAAGTGWLLFTGGAAANATIIGAGAVPNVEVTSGLTGTLTGASTPINGDLLANAGGLTRFAAATAVRNVTNNGVGGIRLDLADPSGNVINNGTGNIQLDDADAVGGNIEVNSTGNIAHTSDANPSTVTGYIKLTNAGDYTITNANLHDVAGNIDVIGTAGAIFTANDGGLECNNLTITNSVFNFHAGNADDVTVLGDFTMNSGTLEYGDVADRLVVRDDFTRVTGSFEIGGAQGILVFNSTGQGQVLNGGPNFKVYDLLIALAGTGVTLSTGSVEVTHDLTIQANAQLDLDNLNIRMTGLNGTCTNGGQIVSGAGGAIFFEGPDTGGAAGSNTQTISGTGTYSNIHIRLADEQEEVVTAANITWNGTLTLHRGTIEIAAGTTMTPTGTAAKISRNLNNSSAPAASDGYPFNIVGTFNPLGVDYDLTFYGVLNLGAQVNIGTQPEFGADVRNLDLQGTPNTPGTDEYFTNTAETIAGNLTVDTDVDVELNANFGVAGNALIGTNSIFEVSNNSVMTVTGNFTLNRGADLMLGEGVGPTTGDLVLNGADKSHLIYGDVISNAAADEVQLTGTGTTNYTGGADALDQATTDFLNVNNAGDIFNVSSLKDLDVLVLNAGTCNFGMVQTAGAPNPNNQIDQNGGTLNFTSDIAVDDYTNNGGGTLDLGNFNLWMVDNVGAANQFISDANAIFLATGSGTTTGFVQFRAAAHNLNTAGVLVPKIQVDPANLDGGVAVTLLGNTGVSEVFTNSDANSGITGNFNFTIGGTNSTWNSSGTYGGSVNMNITGTTVNAFFTTDVQVPQLTMNTTGSFTLNDNDGAALTMPNLTVTEDFTFTQGVLNQNACDIILTGATKADGALAANTIFDYTAGTINQTSPAATFVSGDYAPDDNGIGDFVINTDAAQSMQLLNNNLSIDRFIIQGQGAVGDDFTLLRAATQTLTVNDLFVFGVNSDFNLPANGVLVFPAGVWVERNGDNDLLDTPTFGGDFTLEYDDLNAGVDLTTGNELPGSAADVLANLYMNWDDPFDLDLDKAITVKQNLYLYEGQLDPTAANTVTMASGADVRFVGNGAGAPIFGVDAGDLLLGGPIDLFYSGTALNLTTRAQEWNPTVSTLNVLMGDGVTPANRNLTLHGTVSVGDLIVSMATAASNFILHNGVVSYTINVTNPTTFTMTQGTITGFSNAVRATINVTGTANMTAGTLTNVNVITGGDAVLSGTINPGNATVGGNGTFGAFTGNATVTGTSLLNGVFTGSLTSGGDVTIAAAGQLLTGPLTVGTALVPADLVSNGTIGNAVGNNPNVTVWGTSILNGTTQVTTFTANDDITVNGTWNGTLVALGDVTLGTLLGGVFQPVGGGGNPLASNLTFNGASNKVFTLSQNEPNLTNLTINMPAAPAGSATYKVTMLDGAAAYTLTIGGIINLNDGLIVTNSNILLLPRAVLGFNRTATGNVHSHIVGNAAKNIVQGDGNPLVGASLARFEFPVGSENPHYRPFALQFSQNYPALVTSMIVVNHVDQDDNTTLGFPIDGGTNPFTGEQVKVGDTPPYYWRVSANPSLGGSQKFDVELTGTDPFGRTYDSADNFRVIRRFDGNVANNRWYLQGNPSQYVANNSFYINTPAPGDTLAEVRVVGAETGSNGAIVPQGARFTIGLPTLKPVFTAPVDPAALTATENVNSTVQFTADPMDINETVTYSILAGAPSWISINANSGLVTFTLLGNYDAAGAHDFTVRATDSGGLVTDVDATVTVANTNRAPSFTGTGTNTVATGEVNFGSSFNFTYAAVDADGDDIDYDIQSITPAFAGTATISTTLGEFEFTPDFADAGQTFTVTISATDGTLTGTTTTEIEVGYGVDKGDVDADGDVDIDDAALVLDHVVGNSTLSTAQEIWAADINDDSNISPVDASRILYFWAYGSFPTWKLSATAANVEFGQFRSEDGLITLPINITNANGVLTFYAEVDLGTELEYVGFAKAQGENWLTSSKFENGILKFVMVGNESLKDGAVATVSVRLKDKESAIQINASANLNDENRIELNAINLREIPTEFALRQNYPNPFNPTTTIKYAITENAHVTLVVYDLLGQVVRKLVDNEQEAGFYTLQWDGTSEYGSRVASGIYIYRITAGKYTSTLKMNLLK